MGVGEREKGRKESRERESSTSNGEILGFLILNCIDYPIVIHMYVYKFVDRFY